MKTLLLGAGRVGSAIAKDLAADPAFELTVTDARRASLDGLGGIDAALEVLDVTNGATLGAAAAAHDLVIGAVPGHLGFETVRRVIEAGTPIVDISFFPEDAFELDALARERGVAALVDCGVAPGCSNLVLGRLEAEWAETTRFECLVGGLPVERRWPWEYKAPFSPIDVIEEYTRPARLRRDGREVVLPALTEIERLDVPGVGTLEAFNTDGLRSLLHTCRTPDMVEKTMRYPGHADRARMLRDAGFFSAEPLQVEGGAVRPIDLTSRLLFEQWKLEAGERDLTAMRIVVEGRHGGAARRRTYTLLDRYDAVTGTTSMARTTGYTCTSIARLYAAGMWDRAGVAPPELVGADAACFDFVLARLAERGVVFDVLEETLD